MVEIILSHEKVLKVVAKKCVFVGGKVHCISEFLFLLLVVCREDFTSQRNWICVHSLNLWEHLLLSSLLTKTLLHYARKPISWEHRAQPLGNRSDCNNRPFIALLFHDLAIIYLKFRKFVSSLWNIPLPQPVWTDTQQGTIISLVRWQLFRERTAFFCILLQFAGWIQIDSVAKKKVNVILGYISWNAACKV